MLGFLRLSGVRPLCKVKAKFPGRKVAMGEKLISKENGQEVFKVSYDLKVQCGTGGIICKIDLNDRVYGEATADFKDLTLPNFALSDNDYPYPLANSRAWSLN